MSRGILNWGILAPGKIAHKFANDLALLDDHKIVAVASRSEKRAEKFAKDFLVQRTYASYENLLTDKDVDIVYIATPHTFHAEWAIKLLDAGKHVLCEKPLGVNEREATSIIDASKRNRKFLMEAMWSKFNPTIQACLRHVKNGDLGEVNYVNADFTFYNDPPEESRILNMDLAGGALLDIGIYPLFLAYSLFGIPNEVKALARFHKTGADIQAAATLLYDDGLALIMGSTVSNSEMVAKIAGKRGAIYIDSRWHEAAGYTLDVGGKSKHYSLPKRGKGYTYEIEECLKCFRNGQIESDQWSHQNSLDMIRIMDEMREQIGLRYPFE